MDNSILHEEYQSKLQQLKQVLTPTQEELFNEWLEIAMVLHSYSAIDYKTTGFKEGITVAFDLLKYDKNI